MKPTLNELLDHIAESAQHLIAVQAEHLFQEAYDEAVAEGKHLVKERLLQAMVQQSAAWLAQKVAEEPVPLVPLVPEALASTTSTVVPAVPHEEPLASGDSFDEATHWAEVESEPLMWSDEDEMLAENESFGTPLPAPPAEPSYIDASPSVDEEPPLAFEEMSMQEMPMQEMPTQEMPMQEMPTQEMPVPAQEAVPAAVEHDVADVVTDQDAPIKETELLQELARIREQIDRNEHLLGQLQPFLKQAE